MEIGTALSAINVWSNWNQRRVKIAVSPSLQPGATFFDPLSLELEVEIANLSFFPITIVEAGLVLKNLGRRPLVFSRGIHDERNDEFYSQNFPIRIDGRDSIKAHTVNLTRKSFYGVLAKYVYVKTACGVTKHGTSAGFSSYARALYVERGSVEY